MFSEGTDSEHWKLLSARLLDASSEKWEVGKTTPMAGACPRVAWVLQRTDSQSGKPLFTTQKRERVCGTPEEGFAGKRVWCQRQGAVYNRLFLKLLGLLLTSAQNCRAWLGNPFL